MTEETHTESIRYIIKDGEFYLNAVDVIDNLAAMNAVAHEPDSDLTPPDSNGWSFALAGIVGPCMGLSLEEDQPTNVMDVLVRAAEATLDRKGVK